MTSLETSFHPPRFNAPIDLAEHLSQLPNGAACRGLFFHDPIDRLRRAAPDHPYLRSGEIGARRYVPFNYYPYPDYMRLVHEAARVVHPRVPIGEGLRRMGQGAYDALLANQVGKVIFGVFGRSFSHVVRMGERGWSVSLSFGRVRTEEVSDRVMRYHFEDIPAFLETLQVGVVEGAMAMCSVEGEVRVNMKSLGHGSFEIRWR
jgi:uncharacterized protein (TIGR02265 family)